MTQCERSSRRPIIESHQSATFERPSLSAAADGGWLHLCNGLDPVRDGGMVPSILGMTGALCRLRGEVTIVTPTPSRLEHVDPCRQD